MVFAGGMPRANYSDRHTITVQHGKRHVVFDFTSRVIDFFTVAIDPDDRGGYFDVTNIKTVRIRKLDMWFLKIYYTAVLQV
jgi:hypothetical protein